MTTDNHEGLIKATRARQAATLDRATQALRRLDRHGEEISFSAVAKAARVSRSWLYRQPQLRAQIQHLRAQHHSGSPRQVPTAQRASTASLLQRIEALQKQASRLSKENQALRHQLARKLGDNRQTALGGRHLP
jgi:Family of unknown function (DUF6262)